MTSARTVTRTATIAVVLLLAGCGAVDGDGPGGTPGPGSTTSPAGPTTPGATGSVPPSSPELPSPPTTPRPDPSATTTPQVEAAIADLADHLGLAAADIAVVSHEDVTWPDGSLGCPSPGTSYTQALVPGARLVLAAEGREYSYHAGRDGEFRRCDNPQRPVSR
ncbi:hypothetical protein [Georgenia sp. H159]|uniref:hypothetical protein n=1 Tax=Georgenia sp. H159 TaxID=3076115 RepID=UPI002D78092E|nr:hypothetical protein [Georgenia sp. H159]